MSRSGGWVLQRGQSTNVAGIWYCCCQALGQQTQRNGRERMARPALSWNAAFFTKLKLLSGDQSDDHSV